MTRTVAVAATIAALLAGDVSLSRAAAATAENVALTVSYCPSVFSGLGAVVSVVPSTGKFTLRASGWHWPDSGGWGCPENQDPNVLADANGEGDVFLDFTSQWGFTVEVDTVTGKVARAIKAHSSELAFDGFTSWADDGKGSFIGITPQATQTGFCNDGCFQYGTQNKTSGLFVGAQYLPYKAAMTNIALYEPSTHTYWVQASYPLTPAAACSSVDSNQCLVALDATTGAIKSTKEANSFEVYEWAPQTYDAATGTYLAWVYGFEKECNNPENDFAFARVNPSKRTAELVACIPKGTVVHTDPNVGAFNADGSLFATGSGNSETGEVQLLVFDTATGKAVLNSALPGIKEALAVSKDAPFVNVWGVSWHAPK